MTPQMSQRAARAMGRVNPPPTIDTRDRIIKALSEAASWEELPSGVRDLLERWEA